MTYFVSHQVTACLGLYLQLFLLVAYIYTHITHVIIVHWVSFEFEILLRVHWLSCSWSICKASHA